MQGLYYTPDITDFRVGFECEIRDPDYQGQTDGFEWHSMSADRESIAETLRCWKHFQEYRVPYLTTEQIESEGDWDIFYEYGITASTHEGIKAYKGDITTEIIDYNFNEKWLIIEGVKPEKDDLERDILYNGSCRCINDFRLICKLLNIK